MKKLLILLLLPLFSFSQTYKDVMSIKDVDTFKKVAIENNYEFDQIDDEGWIDYGFNIQKDSIEGSKSTKWMYYNPKDDRFLLMFSRDYLLANFFGTEADTSENPYDIIVKNIKSKCSYYKILNYKGDDYACYSCPESSYKGKIGFMVKENWGGFLHFPEGKSITED